ncbi:phage major tail tube protein [Endozoicomonas euniceicola]|uniref:Phage major tail tube protein n=1 Tax=Endozoicomonas euniceicola TaxID=1234143 RepID=A0ABY6GNL3_9GAMM|nr:phage major tail tube protein [Endozoicomonas euniceicola]UYM14250.1 phage major tail tube protein [Endozoicomonas euniceicola]
MSFVNDVLKNVRMFVDGRGYASDVEELTPPKLTIQTEDYRGGGMDAPVGLDMGMEKLEASYTLVSFDRDVLALFGVAPGQDIPLTFRGALESYDGTVTAVVYEMRGKIREIDPGTWKGGDKPSLSCTMDLHYYKLTHGGSVIHEIDVMNMKRVINGVDRLAQVRDAIGL